MLFSWDKYRRERMDDPEFLNLSSQGSLCACSEGRKRKTRGPHRHKNDEREETKPQELCGRLQRLRAKERMKSRKTVTLGP